jgi:methyl-accepting chemotaxis protein
MVQEIETEANNSAKNTVEAEEKTRAAVSEIELCSQDMQSLSDAMDDISRATSDISKIIKTIEDIAFQTNILALNAAVEAARAGEAGKGFSVVADEVRNLASKSAEAAKNTTDLIDDTVNAVVNGTTITEKTALSLNRAVEHVKGMDEIMRQIRIASDEQALSVEQVNTGVEQISAVVQTNSATAEESAASSEEMMSYAQVLMKLTEHFKIRSN